MESEFLAVGCSDNSVHVWDISNSKMVLKVQSPGWFQLHYMPWIGFYVYIYIYIFFFFFFIIFFFLFYFNEVVFVDGS